MGFGQDSDGHLYVLSLQGSVSRVTGTGAADKPPLAAFTLSSTTPAVGATVHLDASGSSDPDSPIYRYSWDTDGDGVADATGVTADVSYPTAGARAITLTVMDTLGAHSSRTAAVYVGGQTTPPGTLSSTTKPRASLSAPAHQGLRVVRARGLLVRFSTNTPATWTIKATIQGTARLHAKSLLRADVKLASKTFNAHTGEGVVHLAIPRARLAGMRMLVIRLEATVRAPGGTVVRTLLVRAGR